METFFHAAPYANEDFQKRAFSFRSFFVGTKMLGLLCKFIGIAMIGKLVGEKKKLVGEEKKLENY